MLNVQLTRTDGQFINLELPQTPSELTLSQKLDIDFSNFELISFLKKHEADIYSCRGEYCLLLAKCIAEVLNVDIANLLNLPGIDIINLRHEDFLKHIEGMTQKTKGLNINQLDKSLLLLWNHLNQVGQLVEAVEKITYKGVEYELPKVKYDPVYGKPIHEDITLLRSVEIIQANNNYENFCKRPDFIQYSEDQKGFLFTKMLTEIILLLEPDVPKSELEYIGWMSDKLLYWQDIDFQTAYSVDFWFQSYMDALRAHPENKYFFENVSQASTPEERAAEAKGKAASERIWKNVGIKGIYSLLLELNPFQKNGQSKIESIKDAPTSEAVKIISLHNSKQ